MNRDLNGSLNIRQKGYRLFYDLPVPKYLTRSNKNGNDKKNIKENIKEANMENGKLIVKIKRKKEMSILKLKPKLRRVAFKEANPPSGSVIKNTSVRLHRS